MTTDSNLRTNFLLALTVALVLSSCDRPQDPSALSPAPSPVRSPVAQDSPAPDPSPSLPPIPAMDTPASVAQHLAEVERLIRLEPTPAHNYGWLGRVHQLAYRTLVNNPEWRRPAIDLLPHDLREVAETHIEAGEKLRSLTRPVEALPAWIIVEPPPPEELRAYYSEAESTFGMPWQYLAAIHLVETRMGRIRGTSPAGAQGPMQFIPSTWERYGEGDINDPRDSILAAGRYLKAAGAPADMRKALYAYNHSDRYVDAIEIYARHMLSDQRTYLAYYHWQVYVRTVNGDVLLEAGYGA